MPVTKYNMTLKGRRYSDVTLAEAKALYCAARDKSGQGASRWPNAALHIEGQQVGYISYNGRAWQGTGYVRGGVELH